MSASPSFLCAKAPAHPWDAVVSAEMAAVITTLRRNQRWNIDSPVASNSRQASESSLPSFSVLGPAAEGPLADIQTFLAALAADKRVIGSGRQVVEYSTRLLRKYGMLTRLAHCRVAIGRHPP